MFGRTPLNVMWERFCLFTGLLKVKSSVWLIKYEHRRGNPKAMMFVKCPGPIPLKRDLEQARKKIVRFFQNEIPHCQPEDTVEKEMSKVA
jgi:hypothetical protein